MTCVTRHVVVVTSVRPPQADTPKLTSKHMQFYSVDLALCAGIISRRCFAQRSARHEVVPKFQRRGAWSWSAGLRDSLGIIHGACIICCLNVMPEAARAANAYSPPPEDAGSGRPTSLRQSSTGGGREQSCHGVIQSRQAHACAACS